MQKLTELGYRYRNLCERGEAKRPVAAGTARRCLTQLL
jgi:ribosomal protein L40E